MYLYKTECLFVGSCLTCNTQAASSSSKETISHRSIFFSFFFFFFKLAFPVRQSLCGFPHFCELCCRRQQFSLTKAIIMAAVLALCPLLSPPPPFPIFFLVFLIVRHLN